jgi:hypothetical protein
MFTMPLKILAGLLLLFTLTNPYEIGKNLGGWVGGFSNFSKGWKSNARN